MNHERRSLRIVVLADDPATCAANVDMATAPWQQDPLIEDLTEYGSGLSAGICWPDHAGCVSLAKAACG